MSDRGNNRKGAEPMTPLMMFIMRLPLGNRERYEDTNRKTLKGSHQQTEEPAADRGSQKQTMGVTSIPWEPAADSGSHKHTVGASSRTIRQHKRYLP